MSDFGHQKDIAFSKPTPQPKTSLTPITVEPRDNGVPLSSVKQRPKPKLEEAAYLNHHKKSDKENSR
jgi:hypothetical protein